MRPATVDRAATLATGVFIGLALGMPLGLAISVPKADAAPITEDDPGWSCVLDGNHVCGPDNAMGAVPGFYVDGRLAQAWPVIRSCYVPTGQLTDECDDAYVDPAHVRLGGWPVA